MTAHVQKIYLKHKYHTNKNTFANIKIITISTDFALCLLQE